MKPKTSHWNPLLVAAVVGALFVVVTLAAIYIPSPLVMYQRSPLGKAELIALMTGGATAAGLVVLFRQMQESESRAEARAEDIRRQNAVHLDSMHAFFSSPEMRKNRSLANGFLEALLEEGVEWELAGYARHWTLEEKYKPSQRVSARLRSLYELHMNVEVGQSTASEGHVFVQCDAAVSAMVSFFTRLSVHLRDVMDAESYPAHFEDLLRDSVGPFFWTYYWGGKLLPLATACEEAAKNHNEKLDQEKEQNRSGNRRECRFAPPAFIGPLRTLDERMKRLEPSRFLSGSTGSMP